MEKSEILKDQLLITLSYFEPMSLEYIYIDLDQDFALEHPELSIEDLKKTLNQLVKEKKIKQVSDHKNPKWIRIYPQKTIWQRIRSLLA